MRISEIITEPSKIYTDSTFKLKIKLDNVAAGYTLKVTYASGETETFIISRKNIEDENADLLKEVINKIENGSKIEIYNYYDNLRNISSLFKSNNNFIDVSLKNCMTNNVTDMSSAFNGCSNLTNVQFQDTSNVTNFKSIFANCKKLKNIQNLNTQKATNLIASFASCELLEKLNIDCSNVLTMYITFFGCKNLIELNLNNTSNVTNFFMSFAYCENLKRINGIDFSSATGDCNFTACYNLEKIQLTGKISFNRLVLSDSTKLTHETLLSILYALENTENPKKLTLGKINLEKLTDNEKAIATEKNWTLS
jgi:hypothetical protein|nr:MAG TPA: protein of unknown function DUF285 [Caudoviricetes sp.]